MSSLTSLKFGGTFEQGTIWLDLAASAAVNHREATPEGYPSPQQTPWLSRARRLDAAVAQRMSLQRRALAFFNLRQIFKSALQSAGLEVELLFRGPPLFTMPGPERRLLCALRPDEPRILRTLAPSHNEGTPLIRPRNAACRVGRFW
jgi:hypothetical protein